MWRHDLHLHMCHAGEMLGDRENSTFRRYLYITYFFFQIITVHVQLVFNVTNLITTIPAVSVSNIFQGTTVYEILEKAKFQNPCYKATYKTYSFGRSITSICCVASDRKKKHYWMIYVNGKSAQYGVDELKPKDGDIITFKYKKVNF